MSALPQNKKIFPGVNLDDARDQVRAALRRAIAEYAGPERGNQRKFADELNRRLQAEGRKTITYQAFNWWLSEGTFVDQSYWPHIEAMTDMATTRRHLRPDLYGLAAA